jgi:hypothetical protein
MEIQTIAEQLERLYNQVDTITEQYQSAKSDYENLDGQTKTMLAFYSMSYEGSEAKIQRQALCDSEYKAHLEAVGEARKEYNRCWALLEGLRIKLDCLRSLNKHLDTTN